MSKIYVDEIAPKTAGGKITITEPEYRKGEIIEYLSSQCDGSIIEGVSGTYTWPDVTAFQTLTTTYADLTGSNITYTPPEGTSRVTYRFQWKFEAETNSGISHYRFYIDSTEVIGAFRTIVGGYEASAHTELMQIMEYTINCNANSDDASAAQFTSWTSAKNLKVQAREYTSSGYNARAHYNTWRDGTGASAPYTIAVPVLTIIAVA